MGNSMPMRHHCQAPQIPVSGNSPIPRGEPKMHTGVMLDNGIISHSEFAEVSAEEGTVRWGNKEHISQVSGLISKAPDQNGDYQKQKEALFTIGRLIREGIIEAYTYSELSFEGIRARPSIQEFNALQHCQLNKCSPALERSKFRTTSDFRDAFAKGGKSDRDAGVPLGEANQIAFFQWLCTLNKKETQAFILHAPLIRLTQFEIGSLMNLGRFQSLCKRFPNPEHSPDLFHLWTTERHGFDAFLTLEKKLPNLIAQAKREKRNPLKLRVKVLRPLELLGILGIKEPDPVPMQFDRFYPFR
jgi:hypothetical protein